LFLWKERALSAFLCNLTTFLLNWYFFLHFNLQCLNPSTMLKLIAPNTEINTISKAQFLQLCPVLISQIDSDTCHDQHMGGNAHHSHDHDHGDHDGMAATGAGTGVPSAKGGFDLNTVKSAYKELIGTIKVCSTGVPSKCI